MSKIIDFEGVDCSFKETNAIKLFNLLKRKYKTEYASFPRYNCHAGILAKKYINGKYDEFISGEVVSRLFMADMFDFFKTKANKIDECDFVVLDRFWLSNVYHAMIYSYEPISEKYHKILNISKEFALPEPNVVIFMGSSLKAIKDSLAKKLGKDKLENDSYYMIKSYESFKNFEKYVKTAKDLPFEPIFIKTHRFGKPLSELEIEQSILTKLVEVI